MEYEVVRFKSYHAYLGQDRHWITRGGTLMDIKDIGPFHAKNICRLLERKSRNLQFKVFVETCAMVSPYDDGGMWIDLEVDHLLAQDSKDWVRTTTLYKAIEARANVPTPLLRVRNKIWRWTHGPKSR